MNSRFSTFEEIDNRLKIIDLQRQISIEHMRLAIRDAGANLLKKGLVYSIRPALTSLALSWTLKKIRQKIQRIEE
ncbi:hypothetical protein ACT6NV_09470 [Robiginitalea sp. IMCC44478]|uniref:hypothetical protein n=1 Tax=Robiginitalea sp. IMCC44478 TaxID=3459122 RepID=UPI0040425F5F